MLATQALVTLDELAGIAVPTAIERDAAIQRFEYSFEAVWKAAQLFLREVEGLDLASPKGVVRAAFQVRLLDETQCERALRMTDDRNLTSHTYNMPVAETIFRRLVDHAATMHAWLDAMVRRLGTPA